MNNFPTSTTRFSFSAAAQKEGANESSSFSLKHKNTRLTSIFYFLIQLRVCHTVLLKDDVGGVLRHLCAGVMHEAVQNRID